MIKGIRAMEWIAYTVFILFSGYIILTITYLIFGKKSVMPVIPHKSLESIDTEEELVKAENRLNKNPQDTVLRMSILASPVLHKSVFDFSQENYKPSNHAIWFIKNHPELSDNANVVMHFQPDKEDQLNLATDLWQEALDRSDRQSIVVHAAASFFSNLNIDFAIALRKELIDKEWLNPESTKDLAFLLHLKTSNENSGDAEKLEAWQTYKRWLNFSWTKDDYLRLKHLKNKVGLFLWPSFLDFYFLHFRGLLRSQRSKIVSQYQAQGYALRAALNAKDYNSAVCLEKKIIFYLTDIEDYCHYKPLLHSLYNSLTQLAIIKKDVSRIMTYLEKKSRINNYDSEFDILFEDSDVIDALVRNGHTQIALDYTKKRAGPLVSHPRIIDYLNCIEHGLPLNAQSINALSKT